MKNKIFKILSVLVAVIIAFSSISIVVSAAEPQYVFDFPFAQPQINDGLMYIEVIYKDSSSGSVKGVVYIFSGDFSNSDIDPIFHVSFSDGSNLDTLSVYLTSSGNFSHDSIFAYSYNSSSVVRTFVDNDSISIEYYSILGFNLYGHTDYVSPSYTSLSFTFNYGTDALALDTLESILESLLLLGNQDKFFSVPSVGGSCLDYGFLNYSVPVLENLNGTVLGGSSVFGPYLQPNEGYKAPFPYYSYSCSSALKMYNGSFSSSTSYVVALSLNFDKPVYKASFKIMLRDATFVNYVFNSYGSDDLAQWIRTEANAYVYLSIYNITHPIKLYFTIKTNPTLEYGGDVVPFCMSLSDMTYADSSLELSEITNSIDSNTNEILSLLSQISTSIDSSNTKSDVLIEMIGDIANSVVSSHEYNTNKLITQLSNVISSNFGNNDKNFSNLQNQLNDILDSLTSNANSNTDRILSKIDYILDFLPSEEPGGGVSSELDEFTDYMEGIEDSYKVDEDSMSSNLETVATFTNDDYMQNASIELSNMYSRFVSDNPVYITFLITALTLGLAFWVIGRRSS